MDENAKNHPDHIVLDLKDFNREVPGNLKSDLINLIISSFSG